MDASNMLIDYNQAAEAYARNRRIHPGVFQELLSGGSITPASRVLEVGCGTGNYITAVQEETGCVCTGVDPSDGMLAQAEARGANVQLGKGRAEALPFPDHSFDLIYSVDVIHHVIDRPAAYREAFRALAPGGLVCTVTDSEDIIRRREPLSNYFPETVAVELRRYPPIGALRAMMTAAGFVDLREVEVVQTTQIDDIRGYSERAHSSLMLIDDEAFQRGLARLEVDSQQGPVRKVSLYLLLWGQKPVEAA